MQTMETTYPWILDWLPSSTAELETPGLVAGRFQFLVM